MTASVPDSPEHTVVYSERVRNELKDLAERARQRGYGHKFLSAIAAIDAQLRQNPVAFGDPSHHLRSLKLIVFARVFQPLVVTYAVHQEQSLVFARSFKPYPTEAF